MFPRAIFLSISVICSLASDPEAYMNVMQIIKYWGYPVEQFIVTTADGYIIDLYRIPHGRRGPLTSSNHSNPILMVPGLGASSAAFVQNPPESSPAMVLADAGFEIFLLNYRGTRYGQRHLRLNPSDGAFWKFSLDHLANLDATATVDRVLEITGAPSLYWIGHSQGTLVGFMMLADNPVYNAKIKTMFLLTPVGTTHYARGLIRLVNAVYTFVRPILPLYRLLSGAQQLGDQYKWIYRQLAEHICVPWYSEEICQSFSVWQSGPPSPTFNISRQPVYLSHFPDGTSSWILDHYGQLANENCVRHYDRFPFILSGKFATLPYNYSNIATPIYMFWSRNDWLITPDELNKFLLPNLRSEVVKGIFEVPLYNHIDFIMATDNAEKVFKTIVEIMRGKRR